MLTDANPTRVQKMMRHQHDATTAMYVEEVQKLLQGAEEAVTQIEAHRQQVSLKGQIYLTPTIHHQVRSRFG